MRQRVALCDQKDTFDLGFSAPNAVMRLPLFLRDRTSPARSAMSEISHVRKVPEPEVDGRHPCPCRFPHSKIRQQRSGILPFALGGPLGCYRGQSAADNNFAASLSRFHTWLH